MCCLRSAWQYQVFFVLFYFDLFFWVAHLACAQDSLFVDSEDQIVFWDPTR